MPCKIITDGSGQSNIQIQKRNSTQMFLLLSLLLNFLCFIITLIDKLIYCISDFIYASTVEVALVLKPEIKATSANETDK
jgi:hypothetical protein